MGSPRITAFIKFLGTAGARFVVAKQLRASGGVFISGHSQKIIMDPGPGTLVKFASSRPPIDPTTLSAVILTHSHIDHSNDVNIMIDAMTRGGLEKRGVLFAPRECLEGEHAVVLNYLKGFLEKIFVLEPEREYSVGRLRFFTSCRHHHSAETYGIKYILDGCRVSFLVDTKFFPALPDCYRDSDILVLNVVRDTPFENAEIMHLDLEDAKKILMAVKPRKAILTHFGMTMIKAKPWEVANKLAEEVGFPVVAASDGMTLDIKKALKN